MVDAIKIPKGFKQTEVGIIPEDWAVYSFGELFNFLSTASNSRSELQESGSIAYIHYGDIHTKWNNKVDLSISDKPFISSDKLRNSASLKNGDLIVADASEDQEGIAKSVEVLNLGTQQAISGLHTYLLRSKNNLIVNGYKGYLQEIHLVKQQFVKYATGLKVYGISKGNLKGTKFPLPPDTEQKAIAQALSDVDTLIENLEKLITKKRDIKLAAMQQLLTGKTRLPGFTGKWEEMTLGDVIYGCSSGATPSRSRPEFYRGNIRWITSGELNYGRIYDTVEKITKLAVQCTSLKIIPAGTFLMAITGLEAEGTRGNCGIVGADAATNQSCMAVFPSEKLLTEYLFCYYVLRGKSLAIQYCQGTKQQSYTAKLVKILPISMPVDIQEQTAISNVLSDMDAEIQALEKRLSKTRAIKQGMMQELLTGRIRLIKPESKSTESQKKHNWAIDEAVIISTLVEKFGSEQYPLGRKRYTKMSYLFHRYIDGKAEGYVKMAAGPYNPKTKYGGVETLATKNNYIKNHKSGPMQGFISSDNVQQAIDYFNKWYGEDALKWLEQFRYEKNDILELWATVDMAVEDLRNTQKDITVANVKTVIRNNKEWKPKLKREIFSDENIEKAIKKTQQLFAEGQV